MSWIQTYTNGRFEPLDPRTNGIRIRDIAHALSMSCRYTGHCKTFYSVAQHSVLVSQHCDPADALWGLLHDASEAYLCDIATPVKKSAEFSSYREVEDRLQRLIFLKFGLYGEQPVSVKVADTLLLCNEAEQLMPPNPAWSQYRVSEEIVNITPLNPTEAKLAFLERYLELTGE
jgi:5'-deoxynucleotidase YfbR-like HD superfamily hydrolase